MPFSTFLTRFRKEEDGAATISSLFFTVAALALAGLALDQAHAWQSQTRLQVATDAAALAAGTKLEDFDSARSLALEVAEENLGRSGIVNASDVEFGSWDQAAGTFTLSSDPEVVNAVRVSADLTKAGNDAVPTFLLKFVGINSWEMGAQTLVIDEPSAGAKDPETNEPVGPECEMMTVISYGRVDTGGGNHLNKGVCIHGQTGVLTGGGDHYDMEVTFSALNESDVTINHYGPSEIPVEHLRMGRDLQPTILPHLQEMHADLWATLYNNGNPPETYQGALLPDFLYDNGPAKVVVMEGWWTVREQDLEEGTIYVVNGGAQFSGNVDATNVAFIVNGYFGTGGGRKLHFEDVFIFGRQVGLAGDVTWGEKGTQCKKDYFSVYLFGLESLQMGGWSNNGVSTNGVVAASPSWNPGGNMKARNVYFETGVQGQDSSTPLGGDLSINGNPCSFELDSHYELATIPPTWRNSGEPVPARSRLVQ
ncbi:pilus assembly protein TadG-related protein [Histidinibacterium aquaticum]|nr:pilus assembly protein TadG-related protein [Histidinibacterium aquaticum]